MKIKLHIATLTALVALSGTASADFFDGMNNGTGNGQAYGTGNGYGTGSGNMTGTGNSSGNGWGRGQGDADGEVDFTITFKGKGKSNMASDMSVEGQGSQASMMDGYGTGATNASGNSVGNAYGSNNGSGYGSPNNFGQNNMMPMQAPPPIVMQAAPAAGAYPTTEQWQQFLAIQKARQQAFAEILRAMYANRSAPQVAAPAPAVAPKVDAAKIVPAPAPAK